MIIITVECGTRETKRFNINLDDYGEALPVIRSAETTSKAVEVLQKELTKQQFFANDGCRNNQAVNCCIALHVLGYDPVVWFDNFFKANQSLFFSWDADLFMEHVDRIAPYCDSWGPDNNIELAFDKLL